MTRITTLSLLTAAALLAGVGAARAADLVVYLAGRSADQIRHDVVAAAKTACHRAIKMDVLDDFLSEEDCVDDTVTATMRRIAADRPATSFAEAEASPTR